ncbi:MAG: GNAT family N-acetyltransferase [Chloroflexi bacterium]|nr:GNAT family N-acetyltransferase [Chloroflexota bacterium]
MTSIPAIQQYLDALTRGYEILTEATNKANDLGTAVPQRLANEIRIGRFQLLELAEDFADDPGALLSPPYAPLTEALIASQSRALAFIALAYREASAKMGQDQEVTQEIIEANRAAAEAAAAISGTWADLWEIVGQATAQPRGVLSLPREEVIAGETITLRWMTQSDGPLILDYANALPAHDLLFLRRDITNPADVEAWLQDASAGLSDTVLALKNDELVGYAAVVSDGLHWTRHVRELRVVVAPSMRGKGLGWMLTGQAFATAKEQGVRKMVAQMTTDQESALAAFTRLGFEPEAVLKNHVMDRDGDLHDLQIMALDVDAFQAKLTAAIVERP